VDTPELRHARIAIVGGGLAGLFAAWRLQQQGEHGFVLFEARRTLGGRIQSVDAAGEPVDVAAAALDRFDLGPTWFWPALQPQLAELVDALGLPRFAAFEDGDLLVERSLHQPAARLRGLASEPPAARLRGGTGALIAALRARLPTADLRPAHTVHALRLDAGGVGLQVQAADGVCQAWRAERVLLALPPRLAATRLALDPALPPDLLRRWLATPTWMAPHAKYVAVYPQPFWRAQGLSGGARSAVGPLGEIHDVGMPGGHAALFGFLGLAAPARQALGDAALRARCRAQLGRLFGEPAATPIADALKDWAADPLTATGDDQDSAAHAAGAPPTQAGHGPWQGRLVGIASEWSPRFPGYLAGAVDAAERGVRGCLGLPPAA